MNIHAKLSGAIAVSVLVSSSNLYAGPPVPYDDWVVEGGIIYSGQKDDGWLGNSGPATAPYAVPNGNAIYSPPSSNPVNDNPIQNTFSCDHGEVTCKVLVQDDGFLYEQITYTPTSKPGMVKEYLRMIVVGEDDANANASNASFSSESFIPFAFASPNQFDQGLAVKQIVRDSQDNFVDEAIVQKGMLRLDPTFWPFDTNPPTDAEDRFTTKLKQTFSTEEIDSSFGYTNYTQFHMAPVDQNPDSNVVIGQQTSLSQTVLFDNNAKVGEPDNMSRQRFEFRQANGWKGNSVPFFATAPTEYLHGEALTVAGSMELETYPVGGGDNGYDGSAISYTNNDDIRVTWVASTELGDFGTRGTVPVGNAGQPCPIEYTTCFIENSVPVISSPKEVGFAFQEVKVTDDVSGTQTSSRERYLSFVDGLISPDPTVINPFAWDTTNFGTEPTF